MGLLVFERGAGWLGWEGISNVFIHVCECGTSMWLQMCWWMEHGRVEATLRAVGPGAWATGTEEYLYVSAGSAIPGWRCSFVYMCVGAMARGWAWRAAMLITPGS